MSSAVSHSLDEVLQGRHGALMRNILSTVARVAVSDLSVRIVGEHGVGKEWLARVIHRMSARSGRPFVHVECAVLPLWNIQETLFGSESLGPNGRVIRAGLLESSSGGTVYFDAITRLPFHLRQKLLGAFDRGHFRRSGGHEDVHFNIRAIEGMTIEADAAPGSGAQRGRPSLRLGQVCINLPPLRERKEEIPLLAAQFLREQSGPAVPGRMELTPEALELVASYDWPGNVRELRDALEAAAAVSGTGPIGRDHLPPALRRHDGEGGRHRGSPAAVPA
jgi:DNA-binding NtrC family response regulator